MPDRDPLEELFRQRAPLLEQRPTLRTWRRLENRLDQRRGRRTQGPLRPWMYAAAVLLICMTVFGLGDDFLSTNAAFGHQPQSVEELELGAETPARPVTDYPAIVEGNRNQVLQVRNPGFPRLAPAPKYRL